MRCSLFFILLFSFITARAEITAGVGLFSWQEKVPVSLNGTKFDTNATFSSLGPSVGYETLLTQRYRVGAAFSYHSGVVDILKLDGAVSPRRNYKSYWYSGKLLYRITKTFALGPNVIFSQKSIQDLPDSTSYGAFMNFEYDLFSEVKLIQALGSLGDSGSLAYSFILVRSF
ncbi:MAG: hypothetical protein H7256_12350 [Bdellovibrio sp.]|nr:hypothetical protein [Bdellovibrio sp.]